MKILCLFFILCSNFACASNQTEFCTVISPKYISLKEMSPSLQLIHNLWDTKNPKVVEEIDHINHEMSSGNLYIIPSEQKELKGIFLNFLKKVIGNHNHYSAPEIRHRVIENCFGVLSLLNPVGALPQESVIMTWYGQTLNLGLVAQSPPSLNILLIFYEYYRTLPTMTSCQKGFTFKELFREILLRNCIDLIYYRGEEERFKWQTELRANPRLQYFLMEEMVNIPVDSHSYALHFKEHHWVTDFHLHRGKYSMEKMPLEVIHNDPLVASSPHEKITIKGGKELFSDFGDPIYYFAYLAKDINLKNVIITIYGGSMKDDPEKVVFNLLSAYTCHSINAMIQRGMAVICLNLIDLWENSEKQHQISQKMAQRIEASIYKFWQTLKNEPTSLHPDLIRLADLPIYLEGSSFGGRGTIKFSENYPGTFDGYISWNGIHDIHLWMAKDHSKDHLSPLEGIEKIQDRLLILQSFNDQRVLPSSAIHLMSALKKARKDHLAHFFMVASGMRYLSESCSLIGHYYPETSYHLEDVMDQISSFTNSIPKKRPSLTHVVSLWRYHTAKVMNKLYDSPSNVLNNIDQRFVSTCFSVYKNVVRTSRPGFDILNIPNLGAAYLHIARKPQTSQEFQEVWTRGYLPILSYFILHTHLMGKSHHTVDINAPRERLYEFQKDLVNSFSMKLEDLGREYVKFLGKRLALDLKEDDFLALASNPHFKVFDIFQKKLILKKGMVSLKQLVFTKFTFQSDTYRSDLGRLNILIAALAPTFTSHMIEQSKEPKNQELRLWLEKLHKEVIKQITKNKVYIAQIFQAMSKSLMQSD